MNARCTWVATALVVALALVGCVEDEDKTEPTEDSGAVTPSDTFPTDTGPTDPRLPDGAESLDEAVSVRDGETFTSIKFETADGDFDSVHFDGSGEPVAQIPVLPRPLVAVELQNRLDVPPGMPGHLAGDDRIDVVFVLPDPVGDPTTPQAVVEIAIDESGATRIFIDGLESDDDALALLQAQYQEAADADAAARRAVRSERLQSLVEANDWSGPDVDRAIASGANTLSRSITRGELEDFVATQSGLVESIELVQPLEDELADAMNATGTQAWALDQGHDGDGVGIWLYEANGTDCPDPEVMVDDRYTNLDEKPAGSHANHVGNILATVAPRAHVFCSEELFPSDPTDYSPRPWISNSSWGGSAASTYDSLDRYFDQQVYDVGWAAFKSAGNTGGAVTSPAKAFNVVVVGNYNDATTTMNPGSAFVDPATNVDKPDLSAPGTGVTTSEGSCTGTSCAAPQAAAFAADLIGAYSWLRGQPARLKAAMMSGATDNIEGSARYSDVDGAGGIDYRSTG